MRTFCVLAMAALLMQGTGDAGSAQEVERGAPDLQKAFLEHGIHLDVERGLCSIPVTVGVRDDLLEYLLVNPQGAQHESLFLTEIVPSRLNAALLALGVAEGQNAQWKRKDPPPTPGDLRNGVLPYTVESPSGDGFLLYVAWREGGEAFFFRVDDLLRNLETGRSLLRHRWVFLGSRMVRFRGGEEKEVFAADVEGNLVNITFFEQGNTLLTGARPECLKQNIWLANGWLLPGRGSPVELFFSRGPLTSLPAEIESRLPIVPEADEPDGSDHR
ncbi:MAG: YdjY domain-containing protein [Planctomycetota bacterium]